MLNHLRMKNFLLKLIKKKLREVRDDIFEV